MVVFTCPHSVCHVSAVDLRLLRAHLHRAALGARSGRPGWLHLPTTSGNIQRLSADPAVKSKSEMREVGVDAYGFDGVRSATPAANHCLTRPDYFLLLIRKIRTTNHTHTRTHNQNGDDARMDGTGGGVTRLSGEGRLMEDLDPTIGGSLRENQEETHEQV
jgi:hypothetical protein